MRAGRCCGARFPAPVAAASSSNVITGGKCVTTFMAVEPGADPKVYPNFIEFEAVAVQGGTLCQNGKWRAFDGGATGTTPYRAFFKYGMFRGPPYPTHWALWTRLIGVACCRLVVCRDRHVGWRSRLGVAWTAGPRALLDIW